MLKPKSICLREGDAQIYSLQNFLSEKVCKELIEESKHFLTPSKVGSEYGVIVDSSVRTSSTAKLSEVSDNPMIAEVHSMLFDLYGYFELPGDPVSVHNYQLGQEFKDHHDFHDTEKRKERIAKEGQRTWTFVVYLDEDFEGGETVFPELDLTVVPKTGQLLAWNNLSSTGEGNTKTLHRSNPVTKGEKNIITKWFRSFI